MRKLRVGIVGLGRAGRLMHAPEMAQYPEQFEIVAACDHAPDRLENLPKEFDKAKKYTDIAQVLADPEVELVTIATRNPDHTPQAIRALEAGKYVVVDKPIAISYAQVKELAAAEKRFPGKLFLRFNRRFEPAFNHLREILDSGILGKVGMIKIYRHPVYNRRYDWQTLSEFKGGMLNNWGPHLVDQALQLLGAPVKDLWSDIQHVFAAGDADDQIKFMLRGENGTVIDVELSSVCALQGNLYEVWGDRGTLMIPADGKTIHMRYIDPEQKLPPLKAVRENFPLQYGNPEELRMKDETIPVKEMKGHTLQRGRVIESGIGDQKSGYASQDTMWACLYENITRGIPYPITMEEGVEAVRITEEVYKKSGFKPHFIWE